MSCLPTTRQTVEPVVHPQHLLPADHRPALVDRVGWLSVWLSVWLALCKPTGYGEPQLRPAKSSDFMGGLL